MTECAGHRFDAYAMAEDMFFYDLVCGFTSLVLDRYRTVTGMIIMKHESGLYSVTPLDNAGRAPPEGTLDRRDLSIQAGTLHVARCPDPARCLQQKNKHHCIDVQSVARQFMFWFIEWRARIQRPMPPPIECDIENVFRLHSERCAEDDERDWDWRRYAVYNLIREIRDPISSRRGYIKPEDGEPIRRPWKIGDKYIHGVLKWRSIDDAFILREIHCAMLGAMRERLLRRRDPELMTDLWDMAWRDRPDLATLPQPFQSPPRCTNPKRDRNKENVADAEARPGKISRLRR